MRISARGLLIVGLLCTGDGWAAGRYLPAPELIEDCRSVVREAASVSAGRCESYVRGFLAANRLAGVLAVVPEREATEMFSQRAYRTRLGTMRGHVRSRYCMAADAPMARLIEQLLAIADARSEENSTVTAGELLYTVLGTYYLCRGARP